MNNQLFININCWGEEYLKGLLKYTIFWKILNF